MKLLHEQELCNVSEVLRACLSVCLLNIAVNLRT